MTENVRVLPTVREVPVGDLQVDTLNPRLVEQPSQRDAIRTMVRELGEKIVNLAEDIVHDGMDPSSLPICIPDPESGRRLVAVEGNRRVVALKILDNPALVEDVLDAPLLKRLRSLSSAYSSNPVTLVRCVVMEAREQAHHWIELRHRGEQGGRGIVPWGSVEATRFEEREGKDSRTSAALHAVNLVRTKGNLDDETRGRLSKVPLTTIQRVLNDPDVRKALGIAIEGGRIVSLYEDEGEVLKGLSRIVRDAAKGDLPVSRVEHKGDRAIYVEEFKKTDLPAANARIAEKPRAVEASEVELKGAPGSVSISAARSRETTEARSTLIPKRCVLSITHTKTNNIYRELKLLPVKRFPHAVAVLFRVFLELSTDNFLRANKLISKAELDVEKLAQKLNRAAKHLRDTNAMTKRELTGVYRAADTNHVTPWSIETMHSYVHSGSFAPGPSDLKAGWDGLEPYFKIIST